ncbi:branched-chain amino acid transaminase [Candidatus Parcubacteria bacterium]|nr:branched-chain amino acid transaminase [Candidatus Parcubacteria bacterium]
MTKEIIFFNGKFVSAKEAKVSVKCHALNYGTGVFEGIRAWWNGENLVILALEEHLKRLQNSCKILKISLPYSLFRLKEIIIELLKRNHFKSDVYIRPIAFKGGEKIGVKLSGIEDFFAIFASPFTSYYPNETKVRAIVSSWVRIPDCAIPPRAKCCGAYVNSALAKDEALCAGVDEAIVLNSDGTVAEASAANIFIVRNGTLITPPVTANILEGITRELVIKIAKEDLGLEVIERPIGRTELYIADEVFVTGTACNISAIIEIDKRQIGNGTMGQITARVREKYSEICFGKNPKYNDLYTFVY